MHLIAIEPPPPTSRARLVRRIDGDRRWSLLRAGNGFAKSETVRAWLHSRPGRVSSSRWIRLSATDHVTGESLRAALAGERRLAAVVLDASEARHPLDRESLDVLGSMARRVVVIATTPMVLSDLVAVQLETVVIGAETLAYTPEELSGLIPGLEADRRAQMLESTAGSPVLVRLLAHSGPRSPYDQQRAISQFLDDRLASLPDTAHAVLLAACVPAEPDMLLVAHLAGLSLEAALHGWGELVASGLALEGSVVSAGRSQIIPIVRDTVLDRRRQAEPLAVATLDSLAARFFAECDRPVEAARHAILAEDWITAASVIEGAIMSLFATRPGEARALVAAIPASELENLPVSRAVHELLAATGSSDHAFFTPGATAYRQLRAFTPGEMDDALDHTDLADELVTIGWRGLIRKRHAGDFIDALAFRSAFRRRVADPEKPLRASVHRYLPIVYLQCGITSMLAGRFVDAEHDFIDAARDGSTAFAAFAQRNALADLALIAAVEGDVPRAEEALAQMRKRPRILGFWERLARFGELGAQVLVDTERLNLDAAGRGLETMAESAHADELWAFYCLARARFAVAEGTAAGALAEIDALRRSRTHLAGADSAAAFLIPLARAELLMAAGQPAEAGLVLETAPDHPMLTGVRALQRLQIGAPAEVIALAGGDLWNETAGPCSRALGLLARAAAESDLGRLDDAAGSFRLAHALITQFRLHRTRALVPAAVTEQLAASTGLLLGGVARSLLPVPLESLSLTKRESIVLGHLASGSDVAAIARTLFVSENTVRSQVRSLYRKLGVNRRDDAVAEAARRNLVA